MREAGVLSQDCNCLVICGILPSLETFSIFLQQLCPDFQSVIAYLYTLYVVFFPKLVYCVLCLFRLLRRTLKSEVADALNQQLPKPVPVLSLFRVVSTNKMALFKAKRNTQPSGNVCFERSSTCTALLTLLRATLLS